MQRSGPRQDRQKQSEASQVGHPQNGGEREHKEMMAASVKNRKTLHRDRYPAAVQ